MPQAGSDQTQAMPSVAGEQTQTYQAYQPPQYQAQQPPPYTPGPSYQEQAPPTMAAPVVAAGMTAPVAPRKSNMGRNVLIGVILLLLIAGGIGALLVTKIGQVGQQLLQPTVSIAKLIPADAYGYVTIPTHLKGGQKDSLDKIQAAFKSQPGFQAAWDKLTKQATDAGSSANPSSLNCGDSSAPAAATPANLDELTSVLGDNAGIAVLALTKDEMNSIQQGGDAGKVLLPKLLITSDVDLTKLLQKLLPGATGGGSGGSSGLTLAEKYRNVDINKVATDKCTDASGTKLPAMYVALVGSTGVATFDLGTIKGAIDRFTDGKGSLADSPSWSKLDPELPKERLGTLYLNLTALYDTMQAVGQSMASSGGTNPLANMARANGAVELSLTAHDDGFQIDSSSDTTSSDQMVSVTGVPSANTLNDVPSGSWAVYEGTDLKSTVQQLLALERKQGNSQQIDDGIKQINSQFGIDLEKDVLPLLGGDYIFSVQGKKGTDIPVVSGGAEMLLKQGDGTKMSGVLDKINQSLTTQGQTITPVQVGSASFSSFGPSAPFLYGLSGDKLYILATSDTTADVSTFAKQVLDGQSKGMGTDATFKSRIAKLPANSNGLLYADISKIVSEGVESTMSGSSKATYDEQYAPLVHPIQYLLVGGATAMNGQTAHTRGVTFLGIGK